MKNWFKKIRLMNKDTGNMQEQVVMNPSIEISKTKMINRKGQVTTSDPREIRCEIINHGPVDATFKNTHPWEQWPDVFIKAGCRAILPHQYFDVITVGGRPVTLTKLFGNDIGRKNLKN